jgi:glycyl-tRNA synthetase beta chain
VPREVIVLTMRTNQKYFALTGPDGALAPAFVCVANLAASDGGAAIVNGNSRVLSARLADARFFWEQDVAFVRAHGLEGFLPKLGDIVFHEKLGSVADKVERVAALARWLCESGAVPADPAQAERAARLAKADLVSATVGEFPELQGIIGRYLALTAGEDAAVADALRDHYMAEGPPFFEQVSIALALADRFDTLNQFFSIEEKPTGSRDPFALRRAAIQAVFLILQRYMNFDFSRFVREDVLDFLVDRWIFQNRSAGGRPDLIAAVRTVRADGNLHLLGQKMRLLQQMLNTADGANLLAGYKRAANILKAAEKDGIGEPAAGTCEGAEAALAAALDAALPAAQAAVADERFADAMAALAGLRAPVDAFFDGVMVNDPDPHLRARRLGLLARFRDAVHQVADFSKIEG